ncbi:hypothetical protein [Tropicibacter naphthalenivorans]|uniref:Uncharacterized protein n=1 Tax=Tropicibacter naphthalenivorans TaxID=441103 RepID=A0A0P1GI52_9RHOB|nr:hypothetical protein [Tropicibacter naphthalenivorans]CUH81456.1 hypothetical protein TRN7648_03478 [Tropicibacter naphthalenivorans]SMD00346.1 hypothetical protein SAMN04488093_109112 [Tropicibacter naphthalenivorans]
MTFTTRLFCAALLAGLAGCTQFPELDAVQTPGIENAAYPDLVPLDDLLNASAPSVTPEMAAGLEARAAGLRARAARLQRTSVAQPRSTAARVARLRQKAAALRAQ